MRIVNWNIEWMNHWFKGGGEVAWGSKSLSATDARNAAGRAAQVIRTLDPDLLCLQEGPSAAEEMALFIADYLSDDSGPLYSGLIGADGREQKLYALAKRGGLVESLSYARDDATDRLRDGWDVDINGDLFLKPYDFTRLPLVVDVDPRGMRPFRIVILHTKSKYVHGGERLWRDPNRRQTFIAQAMLARRRISAEGFRLRAYLDELIKTDASARIVVTGDFNDGPGQPTGILKPPMVQGSTRLSEQ